MTSDTDSTSFPQDSNCTLSNAAMYANPRKHATTRRGSISAPDPLGRNASLNELNVSRSSSSTLTIVRVNAEPAPNTPDETPPSPRASARLMHKRVPPNDPQAQPPARLSFAFSSFGGPKSGSGPASPISGRPSSPTTRPNGPPPSSSFTSKPRLTADQLVHLARQSTNPRSTNTPPLSVVSNSSRSTSNSPSRSRANSTSNSISTNTTPATFRPLAADIFLPFLDRPAEVSALITSAPSSKLFSLLAQTFPKRKNSVTSTDEAQSWTFDVLTTYLTTTTRDVAPDVIWVSKIRQCILSHSELIWERVKGALGVPAELDCDNVYHPFAYLGMKYEDENAFETDSEDEVEAVKPSTGHWSDWDTSTSPDGANIPPVYLPPAALNTNIVPEPVSSGVNAPPPSAVIPQGPAFGPKSDLVAGVSSAFKTRASALVSPSPFIDSESENEGDCINRKPRKSAHVLRFEKEDTSEEAATPVARRSPPIAAANPVDAVYVADQDSSYERRQSYSYEPQYEFEYELEVANSPSSLSIEPIIASSANIDTLSPSTAALNLHNISEDLEEEEEGEENDNSSTKEQVVVPEPEPEVHGLRISTSSSRVGLGLMHGSSGLPSPVSPLPPYTYNPAGIKPSGSAGSGPHSRTTSFGSMGAVRRSDSFSSLSGYESLRNLNPYLQSSGNKRLSGSEFVIDDAPQDDADGPYDPLAERSPGNPLFPSNFARLSVGPTLSANNPLLRSPAHPPLSRFTGSSIHSNSSAKASSVHSSTRSPLMTGTVNTNQKSRQNSLRGNRFRQPEDQEVQKDN